MKFSVPIVLMAIFYTSIYIYDIWCMLSGEPASWMNTFYSDMMLVFWAWAFVFASKEEI